MNKNFFRTCTLIGALGALAACGESSVGPRSAMSPGDKPSLAVNEPFNDEGNCLAADFAITTASPSLATEGQHCTANDISIATTTLIEYSLDGVTFTPYNGQPIECNKNEPVFVNLAATLLQTDNAARTDVGAWIATDGGNARTGTCNHYNLVSPAFGTTVGGVSNTDNDSCGDMTGAGAAPSIQLGIISAVCQSSPTSADSLHIGSCLSWSQTDVACPDPDESGPLGFRIGTLPGTSSKCNCDGFNVPITVVESAKLEVIKACVPDTDAGLFNLLIDGEISAPDAACGGTTGAVTVGAGTSQEEGETHTFGETGGTGTSLSDYTSTRSCVDRVGGAVRLASAAGTGGTIELQPDDDVICTITNTHKATVVIIKDAVPNDAQDFSFTSTLTGNAAFDLDDDGDNANTLSNTKTVSGLAPGSYTVTEGATAGWDRTSIVCVDPTSNSSGVVGTGVATINLAAGETVTCTYTNTQRATLELRKVENGGLPLSRAWSFELRTGTSETQAGSLVASASAVVATGVITFPGFFTPGAYQLCETGMPVGYTNNIDGFTPLGATPEGGDNSTECINITLVSGANGPSGITGVPNPINNVLPPPPGGDQRTIGYWKNWSSCTGGKQYIKAGERNELNRTLDFYLPAGSALYPIGDITGTPPLTCQQAVRLLGKSDMNTGKKAASDPAYNLAAQFIAAKLNVLAGAGTCPAATTAIAQAQALLDAINFTGTGSYKNMSPANATLANSLATTLDQYNNGNLCPP